jgi:hypothetical protein
MYYTIMEKLLKKKFKNMNPAKCHQLTRLFLIYKIRKISDSN